MADLLETLKTPLVFTVMIAIYHYGIARPEFKNRK